MLHGEEGVPGEDGGETDRFEESKRSRSFEDDWNGKGGSSGLHDTKLNGEGENGNR